MAGRPSQKQTRIAGYVWLALIVAFAVVAFFLKFKISFGPGASQLPGYVLDDGDLFLQSEKMDLESRLKAVDRGGGPMIVVATEKKVTNASLAEDGLEIARRYRIGHKGRDDGVLLLIDRDDHKARIEVGYGLEGVLTDAASRIIIDERMEARLKANRWADAARGGVDGVLAVVSSATAVPPPTASEKSVPTPAVASREPAGGPVEETRTTSFLSELGAGAGLALLLGAAVLVVLGFIQAIALAIPGVEPRLRASKRWSWFARWRVLGSSDGSSSDRDSDSSSPSSSAFPSSSSEAIDSGGSFGGGGAND